MNEKKLAEAVREKAGKVFAVAVSGAPLKPNESRDAGELILTLARILEGKTLAQAFGAPGDWGYETAIGQSLIARPEVEL